MKQSTDTSAIVWARQKLPCYKESTSCCRKINSFLQDRRFLVRTGRSALQLLLKFKSPEGHSKSHVIPSHGNADNVSRRLCLHNYCKFCRRQEKIDETLNQIVITIQHDNMGYHLSKENIVFKQKKDADQSGRKLPDRAIQSEIAASMSST